MISTQSFDMPRIFGQYFDLLQETGNPSQVTDLKCDPQNRGPVNTQDFKRGVYTDKSPATMDVIELSKHP